MGGNYFGNGADGNVTISADTEINSTQDGDYILKQYNTLTIDVTKKLTVDDRCKGLFIYVKGDCVINGELSMSLRGGSGNPVTAGVNSTGIRLPLIKSGSSETLASADFAGCGAGVIGAVANQPGISSSGIIFLLEREGALGPAGESSYADGDPGNTKADGTGSGGAGGKRYLGSGRSGDGGNGTCFSGGAGGGGSSNDYNGGDGSDIGGAGGAGVEFGSGGAGNPNGALGTPPAEEGTGGVIWLIVGGSLTIGASGVISAEGGDANTGASAGGAGSGGGIIKIAYAGSLSNSGSISVVGGAGNTTSWASGGDGGAGQSELVQVDEAVAVTGKIMMMARNF